MVVWVCLFGDNDNIVLYIGIVIIKIKFGGWFILVFLWGYYFVGDLMNFMYMWVFNSI